MKNMINLAIFGCLLMLAGCVPSLNPLYTEQDLVFDSALIGVWAEKDSKETWAFSSADEKQYLVHYTDEDGKKGEFKAHLLKIEGRTFLDLTPVKPVLSQNDFYKAHFLPLHTFVRVSQTATYAELSYLEPEWLKAFISKNPDAIRHEKIGDEILITASTKDLQKFLLAHLNTEGAFAKPVSIRRKP